MFTSIKKLFSAEPELPAGPPPGRNDMCHCNSGKKYKNCCMAKEQRKHSR